jgi:hypothetical protein
MPDPDTTPAARVSARERAEAIADAACPEEEIQARLDDYAVEVARAERIATYRDAADEIEAQQQREETTEHVLHGSLDRETELQGAAVRSMAQRLRARAAQMEEQ